MPETKTGLGVRSFKHLSPSDGGDTWQRVPKVYNRNLVNAVWADQQKARQSRSETSEVQGQDYIEPPFDLDVLSDLLLENVDFFAVVDQFAIDVAGLGFDLVDREQPGGPATVPEQGEIEPTAASDTIAQQQRAEAERFFDEVAVDFNGKKIPFTELLKCVVMDEEALGNSGMEVSRDHTAPPTPAGKQPINGLFHIPFRLMRRRLPVNNEPQGFVQIGEGGKPLTMFREWQSDPTAESSRFTVAELQGLSAHRGRDRPNDDPNETDIDRPKNEFADFRRYHSSEVHYGVPQVIAALNAVYGQIYSDARNLRWFINRSVPDWLVMVKAQSSTLRDNAGREEVDDFLDEVEEHMKHLVQGEDHRTMMLKVPTDILEMEWEELTPAPKDQDYQVYQIRNRDTVIRAYRMLPHRIGIIETASLGSGSGESQEETYKRAQIDPRQEIIEKFVNQILDDMGWDAIRFKFREIDVLDEQREMGMYTQAVASKALTLNEMRRWLSRIVKDQDFPDYDEPDSDPEGTAQAKTPLMLLELQQGGPLVLPFGAGIEPFAPPSPNGEGQPSFGQLRAPVEIDRSYEDIARLVRDGLATKVETHRRRLFGAGRRGTNGRQESKATGTGNADRKVPATTPVRST